MYSFAVQERPVDKALGKRAPLELHQFDDEAARDEWCAARPSAKGPYRGLARRAVSVDEAYDMGIGRAVRHRRCASPFDARLEVGCEERWLRFLFGGEGSPDPEDRRGLRFGKLTVVALAERRDHGTYWVCRCDCGNLTTVRADHLASGHTKSCGKCRRLWGRLGGKGKA